MHHDRYERMIEAAFTKGLETAQRAELDAHLLECDGCRRVFERYASAEQILEGAPPLTLGAEARVLGRLMPAAETKPAPRRLVLGAFAAAAAAILLVVVIPRPTDELTPRGEAGADDVELRVLAVRPDGSGGFAVTDARRTPLASGDHVRLLYDSRRDFDGVVVEVVSGERHQRIAESAIERRGKGKIGAPVQVTEDWPIGRVEIRAVFRGRAGEVVRVVPVQVEGAR